MADHAIDDLPAGKAAGAANDQEHANAAWFRIGALAYNLFLMQQAFALPPELLHAMVPLSGLLVTAM